MALTDLYGSVGSDVARGLSCAWTMDASTWRITSSSRSGTGASPSFAFVAEPQTNGVAERFIRTMKEQAIYGRVFKNIEEVRDAVVAFVETYNAQWRLEKLGFMTPREAREQFGRALAA